MDRVIFLVCVICFTGLANAEIFKWVDEQGGIHYGDKPVENSEEVVVDTAKKGHINTGASREEKRKKLLSAMDEDKARVEKEETESREKREKLERSCIVYKDRLRQMERASYLYGLDAEGNRVISSNEDRDKTTAQLRSDIQKYCK